MSDLLDGIFKIGSATAGIYLFFRGINEYTINTRIKRAEFLEKLINEFNSEPYSIALKLLDDFVYVTKENREKSVEEQKELSVPLTSYLRNHKDDPIRMDSEITVRESFDSLLDFFSKLSYYFQNGLISKSELAYFRYYISKIKKNEAVKKYIGYYFYSPDFDFLFRNV